MQPLHLHSMETMEPDPFEYQLLVPDPQREHAHTSLQTTEELLEDYVGRLNPLIDRIAGSEDEPGYDTIMFLDKSARPLYWMLKEFWPYMAPQERDPDTDELKTKPMPEVKFVNIDRLSWRRDPNQEIEEGGARDVTPTDLRGLRAVFTLRGQEKSVLDGKRILIIDEQSESGDTLRAALNLFSGAFPDSEFDAMAWINHKFTVNKKGDKVYEVLQIPIWYPIKDENQLHKDTGRGVFGPAKFNPNSPEHGDPERFPPESYQFLSTKPLLRKSNFTTDERLVLAELRHELNKSSDPAERKRIQEKIHQLRVKRDPEGDLLRKEIAHMVVDFLEGRIFPAITTDREEVLGQPALEYGQLARARREARKHVGSAALFARKRTA